MFKANTLCALLLALTALPPKIHPAPCASEMTAVDGAVCCFSDFQLQETADAGEEYLARLFFFGESTTAHLARVGGVLDTPQMRGNVLRDRSGTRMLDARTPYSPVTLYSDEGEEMTLPFVEAIGRLRPSILVLSFGLNGIRAFSGDTERYLATYGRLIEEVQKASPTTKILLQTVYPVGETDAFSVDTATLNGYIRTLNQSLPTLASRFENVRVADTASVLTAPDGSLWKGDHVGDGIHLTNAAYQKVLFYLRTHAWNH